MDSTLSLFLGFSLKYKSLTSVVVHSNKNSEYPWPDYVDGVVCSYTSVQSLLATLLVTGGGKKGPEKLR